MTDMQTITTKTADLTEAALDWAVAEAIEAWKTAHQLFPTWTLDATFSGVRPMVYSDGQAFCQLIPNNPMRQEPQKYSPSTDWAQCGPLIHGNGIWLSDDNETHEQWIASTGGIRVQTGATPLIAACRAIVAAKLGDEVDVPADLAA